MKAKGLTANELMIGDWLHYYDDDESQNIPVKIVSIDDDGWCFFEFPDGMRQEGWCRNLYPIPLTPEILEKNGFKYNEHPFVQGWEQFGLTLCRGGDGYRINCGQNVALQLDSVHELQHALKICGVKKEIIL